MPETRDIPKLGLKQLREIVTDPGELAKGARIADEGGLAHLARYEHKLFADAAGSATYKVQILFEDKGVRGRCSCMAARSRPFCKHAAALLVAWSNAPDSFAVSDSAPAGMSDGKKKAVKKGKVDARELMGKGIEQVSTLVRELAVAGVAAMADDRAAQVRALGENLREHKLRRLSGKTVALADMLDRARKAGDAFDESAYTELLADLLLTARKLEKHLGGEALDDRHVEELIGKTWTKKDRAPVAGLDLVEVGFLSRQTADDFVIRESRFVELGSGEHYAEKQILPAFLARRTPPKPSYAGTVLGSAGGSLYPSYAPRRIDLEAPVRGALDVGALQRLTEKALPGVKAAMTALQEHKKDVFAPETLPVAIACDMVIADRGRLQLADADGSAAFLPDDERIADRVATALAGATLRTVVGDLFLDGALPTIIPLAVVVEGRRGLELRSVLVVDPARGSRKIRRAEAEEPGRSNWAHTARAMGLSTAAIALGEVREELAGLLFAGLTSVTARRVEPLATRLRELSLAKQADVLTSLAARTEPAERLDDLIKLHQVLGIALSRLAGAAMIDKAALEASAMFQSVFVRKSDEVLEPAEIAARVARGEINRFEAATRYARHYESLPAEELIGKVFPTWADGSASPFVAHAARRHPERALEEANAIIAAGIGGERKGRYGRMLAPPRMATLTALRVLEALGEPGKAGLRAAADRHTDHTIRGLARVAMGRLAGAQSLDLTQAAEHRGDLLNAASKDTRARAAGRLADMGDVDAIPLLRISFGGDVVADVRDAAGRALGRLGDADSVDTFIQALHRRAEDVSTAVTAAMALGYLGDVRGIDALLAAYEATWRPEIIADALTAVGPAAVPLLVRFVEDRPGLIKRSTARAVFDTLPADALEAALVERLDELVALDDAAYVERAGTLFELVAKRGEIAGPVGRHITAARPHLGAKAAGREARALFKKAGGKPA
ncbi:MAG TPA: HEAT repeat domain-containing protein [Kofleriaceae bacterium]|nr:HEAT repeat domain-containing protein [Kofleriaceae bacterium]